MSRPHLALCPAYTYQKLPVITVVTYLTAYISQSEFLLLATGIPDWRIAFEVSVKRVRMFNIAIRNTSLKFRNDVWAWHIDVINMQSKVRLQMSSHQGVWSINSKEDSLQHPACVQLLICQYLVLRWHWGSPGIYVSHSSTNQDHSHFFRNIGTTYGYTQILTNCIFNLSLITWLLHSQGYYFMI